MKQINYVNPDVTSIATVTSTALEYGNTTIEVEDSSSFAANDFVLFEAQGNEYNEILKISSVDSATQITLTTGIQYPHISGIALTKLSYDSFKITRSFDNSKWATLKEEKLNYANKLNLIQYYDDEGSDSAFYRVYYVNSHTLVEDLQTTLNNEDNFSWISLSKFMNESGLDADYSSYVQEALVSGVEAMRDDLFFKKTLETRDADVEFDLNLDNLFLADFDASRVIDEKDIVVYEYNPVTELNTYINHKIVKLFVDNPKLVFSENVPASGSQLCIEVNVAQVAYEDYRRSYEEINKLYAINYLLSDKMVDSVKNAVLNWTAGGTSVTREPNTVQTIIEANQARITMLMKDLLLKSYVVPTKLRTRRDVLNMRTRGRRGYFDIKLPSGRLI